MNEYEVWVEDVNPCGGLAHARKTFLEVEADSPEAYVRENGRYPITEITTNHNGELVIVTGDVNGYMIRYTFSK